MAKVTTKKRKVIVEAFGEAHINASFNNIIISLTNNKGEVIALESFDFFEKFQKFRKFFFGEKKINEKKSENQ